MSGNTFGSIFKVTTFGESHGVALGAIIDGCPPNIPIDVKKIQQALDRRKPGNEHNPAGTPRKEADRVEILSGIFEGKSTGTPISLVIYNNNQKSSDYDHLKTVFRPGHADYTYQQKYGIRDYRGGGRSSGRETAARVAAGAIALMVLENFFSISIVAFTTAVGKIKARPLLPHEITKDIIESNSLRVADIQSLNAMEDFINACKLSGDSCGGIVDCVITGVPAGLGEPVFDKLDAELAKAIMSIGAIKGIEFGLGFEVAERKGSKCNDQMNVDEKKHTISFNSNNSGGILGGISNGNTIQYRVAIKPVASISIIQQTVNSEYKNTSLSVKGRHDICLCPRIIPVIEAMTAICLADMYLRSKAC